MYCASCQSGNQVEFASEMMIHFRGLRNINDPGVPVSPDVSVCLDCGFSRFTTPKAALALVASRTATSNHPPSRGTTGEFLRSSWDD